MNLLPTAEQEGIVASSAAFLAGSVPMTRVRSLIAEADNVDPEAWRACGDLGWFALGLPEEVGGVGGSLADEALLCREIGRALTPGPFVAAMLGARVAALGGSPDLSAEIAAGARRVALGVLDHEVVVDGSPLSGSLRIIDGVNADHVLVATADGAALVATTAVAGVVEEECIDEGTRLGVARLEATPVVAFVAASSDPVYQRGLVLTAAMLVGISEATRDIGAEHAKTRVQFDRPIGVNQGVKHPCADMAVRCEAAWAQTVVAALAHDESHADVEAQTCSAWVVAADAAERNAGTTLQVLGGMGFTFEHDVNLYLKRTHVLTRGLGDRRTMLDRLVQRV